TFQGTAGGGSRRFCFGHGPTNIDPKSMMKLLALPILSSDRFCATTSDDSLPDSWHAQPILSFASQSTPEVPSLIAYGWKAAFLTPLRYSLRPMIRHAQSPKP